MKNVTEESPDEGPNGNISIQEDKDEDCFTRFGFLFVITKVLWLSVVYLLEEKSKLNFKF